MNTVKIDAKELMNAVKWASIVCHKRASIPVLRMVKLDISEAVTTISATDLDNYLTMSIEHLERTGVAFSVILDPKTLMQVARYADTVEIQSTKEQTTISASGLILRLNALIPPEDFPNVTEPEQPTRQRIPEALLFTALDYTSVSISQEEFRYYLNGVYLHGTGGNLSLISTDGHRLTKFDTEAAWPEGGHIVSKVTVDILRKTLRKSGNEEVRLALSENRIVYSAASWTISARVIDGTYPDYTRVIPKPADAITLTISKEELRRIPQIGDDRYRALKVGFGIKEISLRAADETASLPAQTTGDGETGFNLNYLKAFAEKLGIMKISGASAGDPFTVTSQEPRLTCVLMPMRV